MTPALSRVAWQPSWRIVPSRFPPVQLFEKVAEPQDLETVFALDGLTNPRLRHEVGDLQLVPPEAGAGGPGASVVMAAFAHLNPSGSRFSDGTYGILYAANQLATAVAETRHRRERFMRATSQPRMELDMRVCLIDLGGKLHDLRGRKRTQPAVCRADDYSASQRLGATLRQLGSDGIVYDSVRRAGGECAAVFRPSVLSKVRQGKHLCYVWDGRKIATVYEKRGFAETDSCI